MFIKWVIFIQVNSLSNKNSQLYVINFYTVGNVYTVSLCRSAGQPVSRWSAGQPVVSQPRSPVSRWSAGQPASLAGQPVSRPRSPVSRWSASLAGQPVVSLARRSAGGQPRSPVSRWSAGGQPVSRSAGGQPVSRWSAGGQPVVSLARRSAGGQPRSPVSRSASRSAGQSVSLAGQPVSLAGQPVAGDGYLFIP